jgi:flavin-dependent dehydrogenase
MPQQASIAETAVMPELDADVLILGAGPAGCATALALQQAGCTRVILADRALHQPFRIGESATPDVPALLRHLGVPPLGAQALYQGTLSLWSGKPRFDDFLQRGQGPGWHLDRAAFDQHLRDAVQAGGGRIITDAHLSSLARYGDIWRAEFGLAGLTAAVVVDATGRRAALATRLGAHKHRLDGLIGLAVQAPTAHGLAGLTLVEPCAQGWWYAAPRHGGGAVVALMTDRDIAATQHFRDPAVFTAAWAQTERLRPLVPVPDSADIISFPAHSGWLNQAAGPGWVAVGDALLGLDPLTSSGISCALRDGIAAAALITAWRTGANPAEAARTYAARSTTAWRHYLAQRRERYTWEKRWPESLFWTRRL